MDYIFTLIMEITKTILRRPTSDNRLTVQLDCTNVSEINSFFSVHVGMHVDIVRRCCRGAKISWCWGYMYVTNNFFGWLWFPSVCLCIQLNFLIRAFFFVFLAFTRTFNISWLRSLEDSFSWKCCEDSFSPEISW